MTNGIKSITTNSVWKPKEGCFEGYEKLTVKKLVKQKSFTQDDIELVSFQEINSLWSKDKLLENYTRTI